MIESMQKRGSPLNAHRVATRYFDSFRKERNIPAGAADDKPASEPPNTFEEHTGPEKITAVDSAVKIKEKRKTALTGEGSKPADLKDLEEGFTTSELRVYGAMYRKSVEKKTPTLRLGLKELKELTGLSDKTVRVAIHSLEGKLSLSVVEPSLGVYGRKFYVPPPGEVLRERRRVGLEIDPTTKKVANENTAVNSAIGSRVDTAISNAVSTTVITAVDSYPVSPEKKTDVVLALYESYAGSEWTVEDVEYFESIKHVDVRVIEAALILTGLKGKGGKAGLSQIGEVLADLEEGIPDGYIDQLREAWKAIRGV